MYAVDSNFKEHNLQFAIENDWIADIQSFYDVKPSRLFIEALEPSIVFADLSRRLALFVY